MSNIDEKVMRYKAMYKQGLITKKKLQKLVEKGVLTQEQYIEIVGEE